MKKIEAIMFETSGNLVIHKKEQLYYLPNQLHQKVNKLQLLIVVDFRITNLVNNRQIHFLGNLQYSYIRYREAY